MPAMIAMPPTPPTTPPTMAPVLEELLSTDVLVGGVTWGTGEVTEEDWREVELGFDEELLEGAGFW